MKRAREASEASATGRAPRASAVAPERCPKCGTENGSAAAECAGCGRSLIFDESEASSGSRGSFWSGPGLPLVEGSLDYGPGENFAARYIIIDLLGQGGMGVVYKARDLELNRVVALKMIRQKLLEDPESLERFRREPGLAQLVTHENVCRVHDLGVFDGVRYLSMEYLEADTLSQIIAKLGRLSVRQTLVIAIQIAQGLEAIHARGIVHRDLKPSNVAVDEHRRVVVMDFGLARGPVDPELTEPGSMVGSYAYLAPEHAQGKELTVAVDIYALGLVLYELLTGRRPPGDDDRRPLALRGAEASCPPPSAFDPDVPPELDALVMHCLAWEPGDRPTSVAEVLPVLERSAAREDARTERRPAPTTAGPRVWLWVASIPVLALLVFFLVRPAERAPVRERHLAVAPFTYDGGDPEEAFLAELVTDALSAGITAVEDLRLRAQEDAELRLTGAIERVDGQLQVRARLVDGNERAIWDDTLSGTEPIELIDTLFARLMSEGFRLDAPLTTSSLRTADLGAYRDYLEARSLSDAWYPTTPEDFSRARALFQSALRKDPEFAAALASQAMLSVGEFVRNRGEGDKAVAQYAAARAMAFGAELPESHVAQGAYLAATGAWEPAAAAFAAAVDHAPYDDGTHRDIADLYLTLGRPDEAHAMFRDMISRQPDHWRNYYAYGRSLFLAGDVEQALAHLGRAVELNPDAEGPLTLLGFHYLSAGDLTQARDFYQRALAIRGDIVARRALGLVSYYAGDYELALDYWSDVVETAPSIGSHHADLGDAFRQLGQLEQAKEHYETALGVLDEALSDNPALVERSAERAQVLAALGRCQEARDQMNAVLTTHGHDTQFQYYGALTAGRCGFVDWAVELVLPSIGGGQVVGIEHDPDLEYVRQDPRVLEPLRLIGLDGS